jgi:hypothetical protein
MPRALLDWQPTSSTATSSEFAANVPVCRK